MFNKILVPLDGTLRAEQALTLVRKICSEKTCDVILLEVTNNSTISQPVQSSMNSIGDAISEDNEQINKFINEAVISTRSRLDNDHNLRRLSRPGTPEQVIVEVAEKEEVDLIIMVTHGYAGLERLLLGSVTEKVIRSAPCPVLAIRDGHIPKHFLIALDGTPFSEAILNPAYNLARLIEADITLARIHIPSDDIDMKDLAALRRFDPKLAQTVMENHNNRTESYLQDFVHRYTKKSYEIDIDYDIDTGPPASRLARMAERNGCDLIAMATHGRYGIRRFLEGSITEDVMHKSEKAMLVFHPDTEEDE